MASKFDQLKKELLELNKEGLTLLYSMCNECEQFDKKTLKTISDNGFVLVSVKNNYQKWYTKASRVISQIIPERLDEFTKLYKGDEKRKEVTYMNYSIYDYMIGLQTTYGGEIKRSRNDAVPKMEIQTEILSSACAKFESSIFDIKDIVQADIFDTELDTAKELAKKGFIRAGGAVAGVVLEKHLAYVCSQHKIKSKKAHPTIAEYNSLLKDNDVIDIPNWRFIQRLGDIRNLCDHNKEREPTKQEVIELVEGIDKITKTIF